MFAEPVPPASEALDPNFTKIILHPAVLRILVSCVYVFPVKAVSTHHLRLRRFIHVPRTRTSPIFKLQLLVNMYTLCIPQYSSRLDAESKFYVVVSQDFNFCHTWVKRTKVTWAEMTRARRVSAVGHP